jgi:hypothetical protein
LRDRDVPGPRVTRLQAHDTTVREAIAPVAFSGLSFRPPGMRLSCKLVRLQFHDGDKAKLFDQV